MPYPTEWEPAFMDTMTIDLKCDDDGEKIYYTLDGSEPDSSSTLYTRAIEVNKTTTIKARAYWEGYLPSTAMNTTAFQRTLNPAVEIEKAGNGLNYACFAGSYGRTSDFANKEPQERGRCANFDLSVAKKRDDFGLIFTGYYQAPEDGIYQFWTNSDDGSRLYIGIELVVDNDGAHEAQFKSGYVALKKGYHEIKVLYYEGQVDETLEVYVQKPGGQRERIDSKLLFRRP